MNHIGMNHIGMKIVPLYEVPHHTEAVIDWLWQAFGESLSREYFASIVTHSLTPDAMPITFVAIEGEKLVGTVGLWRCDLITRQDLWPWMAALYVDTPARGKGLAEALQRYVREYAHRRGYPALYLYSHCRDFYERFGWHYLGDALDYPDTTVHLYRYNLSDSDGTATE